jgi:hypothetical protein
MAYIYEQWDSRQRRVGTGKPESATTDLIYIVADTQDDAVVKNLVLSTAPLIYDGLLQQDFDLERIGDEEWLVTVHYSTVEALEVGDIEVNFTISSERVKITQSLQTMNRYAPPGSIAANHNGAIGIAFDGGQKTIEGVEINIPHMEASVRAAFSNATVNQNYIVMLSRLVGQTNNALFKGWAIGEVLFTGASVTMRSSAKLELHFTFGISPNAMGLVVDDITGIDKKGWEYLWVEYQNREDTTAKPRVLVKKPTAVHVERVYNSGDFSLIGIGT